MPERNLVIPNKLGLHARAAAKLVALASRYSAEIRLRSGERVVNGKSIMSVMMLAASRGTQITVLADGVDAEAALDSIEALVRERFGEAE